MRIKQLIIKFKHFGQGGVICSDKIDVNNIISAKLIDGAKLVTPLYKHTVAVGTAVDGQVYTVKVLVQNYAGFGVQTQRVVVASYTAGASSTTSTIAKGLRIALRKALGFQVADTSASEASSDNAGDITNYKDQMFTVTGSSANIVISEVAPYWELGKFPAGNVQRIPAGGVYWDDIVSSSVATNAWATDTYATISGGCADSGKKLADLEYFCAGARGDEYRMMGYPYNIDTKYEVNPATDYDVIDIHYKYVGSNEAVQASEKDITILVPNNNKAFASAIDTITGFADGDPRKLVPSGSGSGSGSGA